MEVETEVEQIRKTDYRIYRTKIKSQEEVTQASLPAVKSTLVKNAEQGNQYDGGQQGIQKNIENFEHKKALPYQIIGFANRTASTQQQAVRANFVSV